MASPWDDEFPTPYTNPPQGYVFWVATDPTGKVPAIHIAESGSPDWPVCGQMKTPGRTFEEPLDERSKPPALICRNCAKHVTGHMNVDAPPSLSSKGITNRVVHPIGRLSHALEKVTQARDSVATGWSDGNSERRRFARIYTVTADVDLEYTTLSEDDVISPLARFEAQACLRRAEKLLIGRASREALPHLETAIRILTRALSACEGDDRWEAWNAV